MIYLLLFSNLLMATSYFWRLPSLPPQIPLFYSLLWGEQQLGDRWMIFIIPVILDVLIYLNGYIYKKYYSDNKLVDKIFQFLNYFLIIGFTYIFVKIIFLIS